MGRCAGTARSRRGPWPSALGFRRPGAGGGRARHRRGAGQGRQRQQGHHGGPARLEHPRGNDRERHAPRLQGRALEVRLRATGLRGALAGPAERRLGSAREVKRQEAGERLSNWGAALVRKTRTRAAEPIASSTALSKRARAAPSRTGDAWQEDGHFFVRLDWIVLSLKNNARSFYNKGLGRI